MKVKGIKQLCSATKDLAPEGYLPKYKLQVHIDKSNGKITWSTIVGNGEIQYPGDDMILVGNIEHPMSMASIRDMIRDCGRVQYALGSIEF